MIGGGVPGRSDASQALVQGDTKADEAHGSGSQQNGIANDGTGNITDPLHSGGEHGANVSHKLSQGVSDFSLKNYLLS